MYNAPSRRAARRNLFLRMFRTEPRSRRRLVLRHGARCCKPLRADQGDNINDGDGESRKSGPERSERVRNK